jgi:hypothetical protein
VDEEGFDFGDFDMPELTPEIMEKILVIQVERIADAPSGDEYDEFKMPELAPKIMPKMFASMMKNGQLEEMSA